MVDEQGSQRVNAREAPHGREHLLRVLRHEADEFFKLAVGANEAAWHTATPCEGWEVRDVVAHMVDGCESYLGYYYIALEGWPATEPLGLRVYAETLFHNALALRGIPQYELIGRLKGALNQLFRIWEELPDEQWAGLNIPHKYTGPVPQFMMVVFQLLDYGYHSWDVRKALGQTAFLSPEAAGTVVPYMVMLNQYCFAPERAEGLDFTLGFDVDGPYGGTWRIAVKDQELSIEEADLGGCQAVIRYQDAEEFCLNAYGRTVSGDISGDAALVQRFRGLFFSL